MFNVTIVSSASTYTDRNTRIMFIILIKEALFYDKKLGHSLVNPNQLRSYGTLFLDKQFNSSRELCIITEDEDIIGLIANGTNIEFDSIAPTDHWLQLLHHVHLISK